MADYPGASDHFLPTNYSFSSNAGLAIVIHKTASGGPGGLTSVFNTFMATMRSTHYGIDLDGSVWQFVPENRGAGGNCCTDPGYNSFWDNYLPTYPNLNLCTFSIEHVDPTTDNSNPMPQAQIDASHKLVAYLCNKYNIDTDHIHSHASIEPINKSRCPGPTYDFQALFDYINHGGTTVNITPAMQAESDAIWDLALLSVPKGTGLYNAWTQLYWSDKRIGPPDTLEHTINDVNGVPMQVQIFLGGIGYWRNGQPAFYTGSGRIL